MINAEYIKKTFPKLELIKNPALKQGVIDAWLLGVKRGNWEKIDDIPFTLLIPAKTSLIEHTNKVTELAVNIANTVLKDNPAIKIDMDILIAGGLTHDVGKLIEYERKDGKIVKSFLGNKARHPAIGYALALEVKLPNEVAHIILAHSHEGDTLERSREAIIINHSDFIDFDLAKTCKPN
ncbi:MAG: HD domain-containing protein [bacterium]|nr:HD domain-containing protein [bacterium]